VTQIGGKSGGGGGMPMTHYLANGWLVVFPSNILLDRDGNHIENGIDPDILIDADAEMANGRDIIIERAIEELRNK
jgi:C-terminal processing protease CtpA/Prc